MSFKVLILVPGSAARGGVTTYFNALKEHFNENIRYLERGARKFPYKKTLLSEIWRLISDYSSFFWLLLTNRQLKVIHTNTSFDKSGVYRDIIYIMITKLFGKKVIVFYRGWDEDYAKKILRKSSILRKILFKADAMIVLSQAFKEEIVASGYSKPVYVETTTVDVSLLKNIGSNYLQEKQSSIDKEANILYLARVEKDKGVFIVLEAFQKLSASYSNIRLHIAGDGKALPELKQMIADNNIKNVYINGFVSGEQKSDLLKKAHIYIFPTNYKEGMPNSILEAFAFGLPVITRPVAGIKDIMQNEENGYLISSLEPVDFVEPLRELLDNKETYRTISQKNYTHAERFYSTNICKRLNAIYSNYLN